MRNGATRQAVLDSRAVAVSVPRATRTGTTNGSVRWSLAVGISSASSCAFHYVSSEFASHLIFRRNSGSAPTGHHAVACVLAHLLRPRTPRRHGNHIRPRKRRLHRPCWTSTAASMAVGLGESQGEQFRIFASLRPVYCNMEFHMSQTVQKWRRQLCEGSG